MDSTSDRDENLCLLKVRQKKKFLECRPSNVYWAKIS